MSGKEEKRKGFFGLGRRGEKKKKVSDRLDGKKGEKESQHHSNGLRRVGRCDTKKKKIVR